VYNTQAVRCDVDLRAVLDSGSFDAGKASMAAGWQQVIWHLKIQRTGGVFKPFAAPNNCHDLNLICE